MVCCFRTRFLVSGPFSSVAPGDIFTYSSKQSELDVSDTCLTLRACVAVVLYRTRADDEQEGQAGVPAHSVTPREVRSMAMCCWQGQAAPASSGCASAGFGVRVVPEREAQHRAQQSSEMNPPCRHVRDC